MPNRKRSADTAPLMVQHAVETFDANLPVKSDLGQMSQAVGVVRIRFVGRHVEMGFGMARIDADRGQTLCRQRMVEPHRQGASLEHDPLGLWSTLADHFRQKFGVRCAFPAPDPLAILTNRDRSIFQGNIEADILFHGCPPFDAWARSTS